MSQVSWIFSGIGVAALLLVVDFLRRRKNTDAVSISRNRHSEVSNNRFARATSVDDNVDTRVLDNDVTAEPGPNDNP